MGHLSRRKGVYLRVLFDASNPAFSILTTRLPLSESAQLAQQVTANRHALA